MGSGGLRATQESWWGSWPGGRAGRKVSQAEVGSEGRPEEQGCLGSRTLAPASSLSCPGHWLPPLMAWKQAGGFLEEAVSREVWGLEVGDVGNPRGRAVGLENWTWGICGGVSMEKWALEDTVGAPELSPGSVHPQPSLHVHCSPGQPPWLFPGGVPSRNKSRNPLRSQSGP